MAKRRLMIPALQAMVERGQLTADEASDLLDRAASSGEEVDAIIAETHPDLRPQGLSFPFIDVDDHAAERVAMEAVPGPLARRHCVLPLRFEAGRLVVAIPDANNVIAIDDVQTACGRELQLVLGEPAAIRDALARLNGQHAPAPDADQPEQRSASGVVGSDDDPFGTDDSPAVRMVNQVVAQAVQQQASDLHIEPQEKDVRVRARLDGVLYEIGRFPREIHAGVVSRLKIMAELNIAEKRLPQDGRMTVKIKGSSIDLRIATVPSVWGEEVILRILDRSSSVPTLEDLGFLKDTLDTYSRAFRKPHGAILVVGPTGSGKSTTLYSTLSVVNDVARKIITVEDPVEFRLPGISQIHMNPKAGLSFATALRSILRSDPDIVMVGEIRDTETARIAVEAAMTGHLVFSTLHTNDAPSSITRLIEMGVEPFLVASALECVLAQRLARKLCSRCKEAYTAPAEVLGDFGLDRNVALYRAVGCNHCSGTGYRGRIALVELMLVTEEIERLTVERKSSDDIRHLAIKQGMRSLRDDGMEKVRLGITSLEEVLRIVEGRQHADLADDENADLEAEDDEKDDSVVPIRAAV